VIERGLEPSIPVHQHLDTGRLQSGAHVIRAVPHVVIAEHGEPAEWRRDPAEERCQPFDLGRIERDEVTAQKQQVRLRQLERPARPPQQIRIGGDPCVEVGCEGGRQLPPAEGRGGQAHPMLDYPQARSVSEPPRKARGPAVAIQQPLETVNQPRQGGSLM
jgi:hypothetical protein